MLGQWSRPHGHRRNHFFVRPDERTERVAICREDVALSDLHPGDDVQHHEPLRPSSMSSGYGKCRDCERILGKATS